MKKSRFGYSVALLFCAGLVIGYFLPTVKQSQSFTEKQLTTENEVEMIKNSKNVAEQSRLYIKLIERVGPEKAQEELHMSGLPYTGNTHLLNHTVGEFLYQKFGTSGIIYCRDYFSSSCYHGVIINALGDGNLDKIDKMMSECRKIGRGQYANCIHGLGHGFLPYVGYSDLTGALQLCDRMRDRVEDYNPEGCYSGVFMENIWGVHEGTSSPDRWINPQDPYYPCNDPNIADRYLDACWENQHTIMMGQFRMDFPTIGEQCAKLTVISFKENCFDGLFNSVFNSFPTADAADADARIQECAKMPTGWISPCLIAQVKVGISHGDKITPFEICKSINSGDKKECYANLNKYIGYLIRPEQRGDWCTKIPADYKEAVCFGS